jgi:chemotaxis signal transduction protein
MSTEELQEGTAGRRHLVAAIAGHRVAVPVDRMRELSEVLPLAFLPLVPAWFRGVANLRGDALVVVDLLPFLGSKELPEQPSNRLLVIGPAEGEVVAGLLVEKVFGAVLVPAGALRTSGVPRDEETLLAPWLSGYFDQEHGEVAVLDVDRLLAAMAVS